MNPERSAMNEVPDIITKRIDKVSGRRTIEADEIDHGVRPQRSNAAAERPILFRAFAIYHNVIAVLPFIAGLIGMPRSSRDNDDIVAGTNKSRHEPCPDVSCSTDYNDTHRSLPGYVERFDCIPRNGENPPACPVIPQLDAVYTFPDRRTTGLVRRYVLTPYVSEAAKVYLAAG
jgi:hypothetical protein